MRRRGGSTAGQWVKTRRIEDFLEKAGATSPWNYLDPYKIAVHPDCPVPIPNGQTRGSLDHINEIVRWCETACQHGNVTRIRSDRTDVGTVPAYGTRSNQ